MLSLLIRNLFFTIIQPGVIVGLIPVVILGDKLKVYYSLILRFSNFLGLIVFAGMIVCMLGFVIMLFCILSFAILGRGTLSPLDPTKKLVVSGFYRYSRNPMYIGVLTILIGEALLFQSVELGIYTLIVFVAFHFYILLFEEPRLTKVFGEEYKKYCEQVRRWV